MVLVAYYCIFNYLILDLKKKKKLYVNYIMIRCLHAVLDFRSVD